MFFNSNLSDFLVGPAFPVRYHLAPNTFMLRIQDCVCLFGFFSKLQERKKSIR